MGPLEWTKSRAIRSRDEPVTLRICGAVFPSVYPSNHLAAQADSVASTGDPPSPRSRREFFLHALSGRRRVLPSMLLCDFSNLEREIRRLEDAGAAALHLDVMDGQFVPNFTYGITVVEACRKVTPLPLDVHLMMVQPERYLTQFAAAGADQITFHAEAVADPLGTLQSIRGLQLAAGIAFNLGTSPEILSQLRGHCDTVLAMSVRTGFGGQKLDRRAFTTLKQAREILGPQVFLEIDGGVNLETVADCAAAGAQLLVAGAAVFRAQDYRQAIRGLETAANDGTP